MLTTVLVSLITLLVSAPSDNQTAKRVVSGMVTDSTGSAAPNAFIEVIPRGDAKDRGTVSSGPGWVKTDQGKFSISLVPGRYRILAKDETSGYPDPIYLLNNDPSARFPDISVREQDISGVQVRLGKKGGTLEGEVKDQSSGSPIFQAKVTIRDARNPGAYVDVFTDKSGHFQFAVLSKPIVISVTAPGYKTIVFQKGAELVLSQGELRAIVIELGRQ